MADSLLSSIATFHTMKIIVTDPSKYSFIGSIPAAMYACMSDASNVIQEYKKHPSSGPRELTPAMTRSIKEVDKPAKRGKKPETQKEVKATKPTKGDKGGKVSKVQTPRKRKSEKAAPAQPKPKKVKKPARRLTLQSSSDSDSEYVPPTQPTPIPSESNSESSEDEGSARGDTPPHSPTPEVSVRSKAPSPPPVYVPVSIPPIFPITTSQPSTTIPISAPIFTEATTTTTTGLEPTDDDEDAAITKRHLKAVTEKLDQLLSSSSTGAYSDAALKALFSSVVKEHDASLSAAAKAIDASTSQCQKASLAVEASTKECKEATAKVDKLISKSQLFLDSLQAGAQKNSQTVNVSVDNLQRSLQAEMTSLAATRQDIEAANATLHDNVNDRLTQLEAKLAVENRIMDELDKRTSQLKMQNLKLCTATNELNDLKSERESTAEPQDNEASVSKRDKRKKKIGEDDTDNDDDYYEDTLGEIPSKPFQKTKLSEKEFAEKIKKQTAELEKKQKQKELLEKNKSIFPEWTIDLLQRDAIEEPSTHWLKPVMSFGLENSKDAQFDMPITRKAFIFHCFNSTAAIPSPDPKVDRDLLEFYLEFAQPQYLTWCS
ncbi:uncharacterized protein LOC128132503 [Lactuca sativa]|uniref:uncharacterized protein LOC128132503 n=1 Tax=Lactuca sativa TaxID=4236 RepID=UPI000CD8338E|nr:uncharacterized protein LOC128132503 [Lactuca sativa]